MLVGLCMFVCICFSQFSVGEGLLPSLVFFVTLVRRTSMDYKFFCDCSEQPSVTFHVTSAKDRPYSPSCF